MVLYPTSGQAPCSEAFGSLPTLTLKKPPVPRVITTSPTLKAHSEITGDWASPIHNKKKEEEIDASKQFLFILLLR